MGRRLRTKVPAMPSVLEPNVQDTDRRRVQLREDEYRSKQQTNHDEQHQAHALLPLATGEQVWVRDQNRESDPGIKQPRSYLVKTDMSKLRRNRSALVPTSSKPASPSDGPTMAPSAQALPVNHTPPKVSTPSQRIYRLNLQHLLDQQQLCQPRKTIRTPGTRSPTERVTRSERVVKPPQRLDL